MLKHQQIKERIINRIDELKAGDALPSVRRMLEEFSCSQATLKRALDDLEAQGVIWRKTGAGIFVMERLLDHGAIGMISPNMTTRMSSQIMAGIQEEIGEKRCTLISLPSRNVNLEQLFLMVKRSRVFGTIINPTTLELENPDFLALVRKLASAGIRMVGVDLPIPGVSAGFVTMNNQAAFAELGALLRQRTIRRVAFVGRFPSKVYAIRQAGFRSGGGSAMEIVALDSSAASVAGVAAAIRADGHFDAVILADANTSMALTYELRCAFQDRLEPLQLAGIVEEGDLLPWPEAWSLEKPNGRIGREATQLLLNSPSPNQTRTLGIRIRKGAGTKNE